MGSITSRGDAWPPKPYRRLIVRDEVTEIITSTGEKKRIVRPVEDYIWVYPGEVHSGGGGVTANWAEETSPGQENAIRNLEDG